MSRLKPTILAGILICGNAVQSSGAAQTFAPLADTVSSPATANQLARCGALYHAVMEWAGENRMGAETWETTNAIRQNFIFEAIKLSANEEGGTLESWNEPVSRKIREFADTYSQRFENNNATDGDLFGSDELIHSDLETCLKMSEDYE